MSLKLDIDTLTDLTQTNKIFNKIIEYYELKEKEKQEKEKQELEKYKLKVIKTVLYSFLENGYYNINDSNENDILYNVDIIISEYFDMSKIEINNGMYTLKKLIYE